MNLVDLGKQCKDFRLEIGLLQSDVASDTGYSVENVSKFENGKNNNLKIFLWYVSKGITLIID